MRPVAATVLTNGWPVPIALVLSVAAVALHASQLVQPLLAYDDFQIILQSYTWSAAWQSLLQPHNEHVMPLGRISTWLLVQAAGPVTHLPAYTAWQGPLAVVLGMALLCVFVRRELDSPAYGLLAMALFGVSSQYREAVTWFAASFSILALDTMLLALLAAQRWRQTGRQSALLACTVAAGLAPCWFASGVLAGPLCCLYLLLPGPLARGANNGNACWRCLFPLLGTAVFLLLGLLPNLRTVMNLPHWQEKTASEAIHPVDGIVFTARSLIDNQVVGTVGIPGVNVPLIWLIPGLFILIVVAAFWWWRASDRRLLALGLSLILVSDWLVYSARAEWGYERISGWSRYQLLPHLGLVLFIVGGLPNKDANASVSRWRSWRSRLLIAVALGLLFCAQIPAGIRSYDLPAQRDQLELIEAVDARCRDEHIDAATARQALGWLAIDGSPDFVNGWNFLRGSDTPRVLTVEEARALLALR